MHESAAALLTRLVKEHVLNAGTMGDRVLEVGSRQVGPSDWTPRRLFDRRVWKYLGLDIEAGTNVDCVVKELGPWPEHLAAWFDVVVSANALEHCQRPWEVAQNVLQVLKPGGYVIFVAPFMWPLHDFPSDYFRFTGAGLASLIEAAGGHVLESGQLESSHFKFDAFAVGRKP